MFRSNGREVLSAIAMTAILALSAPGLAGGATLDELRQAERQADQAYSQAQRDHANGDATLEELEAARENLRQARKESWKARDEASQREYQEFIATLSPVDEDPAPAPAPDAGDDAEAPAAPRPADDENGNAERDLPVIDIPLGEDPPRRSRDENGNPVVDGALGEGGGDLPPEDPLDVYHRASAEARAVRERFEDGQATEKELERANEWLREAWRQWWKARQTADQAERVGGLEGTLQGEFEATVQLLALINLHAVVRLTGHGRVQRAIAVEVPECEPSVREV